jgi:hypothetical protein
MHPSPERGGWPNEVRPGGVAGREIVRAVAPTRFGVARLITLPLRGRDGAR